MDEPKLLSRKGFLAGNLTASNLFLGRGYSFSEALFFIQKGVEMDEFREFTERYCFNQKLVGATGVEMEWFLEDLDGVIVPHSQKILALTATNNVLFHQWTPELSACQIEFHTLPCKNTHQLETEIRKGRTLTRGFANNCKLVLSDCEIAPPDISTEVYPLERYNTIAASMSSDVLRAACSVAGTHIHKGMPSLEEAVRTCSLVSKYIDSLIQFGDHSNGRRMEIYGIVAPHWRTPQYRSVEHYFEIAKEQGFASDPTKCWHIARINPTHGTLEVRTFGVAKETEEILLWNSLIDHILAR
ncbi:MAG: glutamate-cysteine ligase family protein [bacterium]|nr:glutamate-cysteine ligase family protein [bacterium]